MHKHEALNYLEHADNFAEKVHQREDDVQKFPLLVKNDVNVS